MTPFLKHVADDLRKKFGNDLSRVVVVFPNKRASLFLNDYLLPPVAQPENEDGELPVWAPAYETVSGLFRSLSPLSVADPIDTVCRIYDIYAELTRTDETLDFFYGWGERLLADFDDADKNMADVRRLFRSLKETKEIEAAGGFVNEEQERVVQDFFRDFSLEANSRMRQKFLELWECMLPLYERLNSSMEAEGLAYEGALYRRVAEGLGTGTIGLPGHVDCYAFVGFNVLNRTEEQLFAILKEREKALFYWDYDLAYAAPGTLSEAGAFLRGNLRKFPNELPERLFDNLRNGKQIEFVSATTESAQARSVAPWLRQHLTTEGRQTAVVLAGEGILQSVIHSLPPDVGEANITKGFPLVQTPAGLLLEDFPGRAQAETPLAYLDGLTEEVCRAALELQGEEAPATGTDGIGQELYAEAYFQLYTILGRFRSLVEGGRLRVGTTTLQRLLRQVAHAASVPFHGEPAVGLQVMGMLETRCLDFENVLLLSAGEGNLPQRASTASFIPPSLRREFGLTTPRHKTAVQAYYFYRLIQRAHHVRITYNNSTADQGRGEMSRFMVQLLVESGLPIRHLALGTGLEKPVRPIASIAKPEGLPRLLGEISPSAINTYLRCQLQFYFQRIARLREPDPPADVIEPNTLGTIFHHAAELIYKEKLTEKNGLITASTLQNLLDQGGDALLLGYVRRAFQENGVAPNVVVEEVVKTYLQQLLRHDLRLVPFEVKATETQTELPLEVPCEGGTAIMKLKGTIDRLDVADVGGLSSLRVVDYKTGGQPEAPQSLDQLFTPSEKHPHYALQAFLYSLTLVEKATLPIVPALFFVHKAAEADYSPYIPLGPRGQAEAVVRFQDIAGEFREKLVGLLAEILDPKREFVATATPQFCNSCPYKTLCGR